MKKKNKIILISSIVGVLLIALALVLILTNKKVDDDYNNGTEELYTPKGVKLEGTVLSWEQVEKATRYIVYVNEDEHFTENTSLDLKKIAKERDDLSVVAIASGYKNSKHSIVKKYITVLNQEEINKMSNTLESYLANQTSQQLDENVKSTINNIATTFYKEGLQASDITQICNWFDNLNKEIEDFSEQVNPNVGDYVEIITNQISTFVDLNVTSFAATYTLKEVALLYLNLEQGYKKLSTEKSMEEKLYDYLNTIDNRDLERVATLIESLKQIYLALEVKLPNIIKMIDETQNEQEIANVLENITKIKDDVFNALVEQMLSMSDFTDSVEIFAHIYENIVPSYLAQTNPFETFNGVAQQLYAKLHQAICFINYIDVNTYLKIKPNIQNLSDITTDIFTNYQEFSQKNHFNDGVGIAFYICNQAGLSTEETLEFFNGINILLNTDPTEVVETYNSIILDEITKIIDNADFSLFTSDPLINKLIDIINSKNKKEAITDFLKNDLVIEKIITFKPNKNTDDLVNALFSIDIYQILSLAFNNNPDQIYSILGLDEIIVSINQNALLSKIFDLIGKKGAAFIIDLQAVTSLDDIFKILSTYFKIENIQQLPIKIMQTFLEEYQLNYDYVKLLQTLFTNLKVDQMKNNLTQIVNILQDSIASFNDVYLPLNTYIKLPNQQETLEFIETFSLKLIFQDQSDQAVSDATKIINDIVSLFKNLNFENDILNNFQNLKIDFNKYLNDQNYQQEKNQTLILSVNNLVAEYNKLLTTILNTQSDTTNITHQIENFIAKYFYYDVDITMYVEYFYQFFAENYLDDRTLDDIKEFSKSFINNDFIVIVTEVSNMLNNIKLIGEDAYEDFMVYKDRINELFTTLVEAIYEVYNQYGALDENAKLTLYSNYQAEIEEFIHLIQTTIEPQDIKIFKELDESMTKILLIFDIDNDTFYTDLYDELMDYLDSLKNYQPELSSQTITFYHAFSNTNLQMLNQIKQDFETEYPMYTVELIGLGSYDAIVSQNISYYMTGQKMPTVALTYPEHVEIYKTMGDVLVNLDSYINDPTFGINPDDYITKFFDESSNHYAIPFNKSTEVLYYNKTLFDTYNWDVPTTWDEVEKIANAWKNTPHYQNATYNNDFCSALVYDDEANMFITLTTQFGATYTSVDENQKGIYNAFGANQTDMEKSKQALTWAKEQYQNNNLITSEALPYNSSTLFRNQAAIMAIGSSAGAQYYDGTSSLNPFETGVAIIPQKDENTWMIQQGTNISLFKSTPEEELAGWLWIKYLTGYHSILQWSLNTNYIPVRFDVINSIEYENHLKSNTLLAKTKQLALYNIEFLYTYQAFCESQSARSKANELVCDILYQNKDIDQAYLDAYLSLNY